MSTMFILLWKQGVIAKNKNKTEDKTQETNQSNRPKYAEHKHNNSTDTDIQSSLPPSPSLAVQLIMILKNI